MVSLKHAPIGLVLALGLKASILGISPADSAVAVALVGLLSLREYLEKNKQFKEHEESTSKKLEEMQKAIDLQNKVIKASAEEFDKLRNAMTAVKMGQSLKEQTINNNLSKLGVK